MRTADSVEQSAGQGSFISRLLSFLFLWRKPFHGMLFCWGTIFVMFNLLQILLLDSSCRSPDEFYSTLIMNFVIAIVLAVIALVMYFPAMYGFLLPVVRWKWLRIILVILTIVGPLIFVWPLVGVMIMLWSSYKQRKWLAFGLMAVMSLLSCLWLIGILTGIHVLSLIVVVFPFIFAIIVLAEAVEKSTRPSYVVWAFLPLLLSVLLFIYITYSVHLKRQDNEAIRQRISAKLDYPMGVEELKERLTRGASVSEAPFDILISQKYPFAELENSKGNETMGEYREALEAFEAGHEEFVQAVKDWMALPPQVISYEIPEGPLYSVDLAEVRISRNIAKYLAIKTKAYADDKQCVAECNRGIMAARQWAVRETSPTVLNTIVAIAIDELRLNALCWTLAHQEYTDEEWQNLLGNVPDVRRLLARAFATEEIIFEDFANYSKKNNYDEFGEFLGISISKSAYFLPSFIMHWTMEKEKHLFLSLTEEKIDLLLRENLAVDDVPLTKSDADFVKLNFGFVCAVVLPPYRSSMEKCLKNEKDWSLGILAKRIADYHRQSGGQLPESLEELAGLPGVPQNLNSVVYEKGEVVVGYGRPGVSLGGYTFPNDDSDEDFGNQGELSEDDDQGELSEDDDQGDELDSLEWADGDEGLALPFGGGLDFWPQPEEPKPITTRGFSLYFDEGNNASAFKTYEVRAIIIVPLE